MLWLRSFFTKRSKTTIAVLPDELIVKIIGYCEISQIILVCKKWKLLVDRNLRAMKKYPVLKTLITEERDHYCSKLILKIFRFNLEGQLKINYWHFTVHETNILLNNHDESAVDIFMFAALMSSPKRLSFSISTRSGWNMLMKALPAWWLAGIGELDLYCSNDVLTTEYLSSLARMKNLHSLFSDHSSLTTAMVEKMQNITSLNVRILNNKSMDTIVERSTKLWFLSIADCRFTDEKLIEFFEKADFAPQFKAILVNINGKASRLLSWLMSGKLSIKSIFDSEGEDVDLEGDLSTRVIYTYFSYRNTKFGIRMTFKSDA